MKVEELTSVMAEINNTVTEAMDLKVGDNVMFKKGHYLAGVPGLVVALHDKMNSVDIRIGGGNGLVVDVKATDLMKLENQALGAK